LIWDEISNTEDVITNDSVVKTLDKLIIPICEANDIERDSLKIHIVQKDEINAFALPNNHLVVYTGLIEDCKKQEALQGVLGHEIAHIEKNHVMKKIVQGNRIFGFVDCYVQWKRRTNGKGSFKNVNLFCL